MVSKFPRIYCMYLACIRQLSAYNSQTSLPRVTTFHCPWQSQWALLRHPSTHSLQTAHTCYQENILANEHAKHVKGNNTHRIRARLRSNVMFLLCGKFMFYDVNLIYSVDVVNIAMQVYFSICWNNYPDEYPCQIYNAEIKLNVCFD